MLAAQDIIFMKGFVLPARVGLLPKEREAPQRIAIDLEFSLPPGAVGPEDCLSQTIDYDAVKQCITAVVAQQHYDLVETLAYTIANALQTECRIATLVLSVSKLDIYSDVSSVGVRIARSCLPNTTVD